MIWTKYDPFSTHVIRAFERAFERAFPFACAGELAQTQGKADQISRYLASSHDLTELEVNEQLDLLGMRQRLARATADMRSFEKATSNMI